MATREEEKAAQERAVFLGFAEIAGLPVRVDSVESREPPEPDILCELEGEGPVAFEMVQIVDSGLAESISVAVRKDRPAKAVCVGDPTLERIREKVEDRTYATPHPVELVAWGNPITTPCGVWLPMYEPHLRAFRDRSQFRRIWVVNLLRHPPRERGVWFTDPPRGR